MLSAKQGNYLVPFLKRLWYDAVFDWDLPHSKAALLSLGYRGGGVTKKMHASDSGSVNFPRAYFT